ncbi:MAG: methyltransferase domain-containing protein [Proteobacteria bacterium]|nr:methyltransferase domain-containing protein [Pseudomonadota bacterium]
MPNPPLSERLLALWDHLGLGAAHVATQIPADLADFAARHPTRVAGAVLCAPVRLDPTPFAAVAARTLLIGGDRGLTAATTERAAARLPGAQRLVLADYDALGWSDVVADRSGAIAGRMTEFLAPLAADTVRDDARDGVHAGLAYRITGAGPALVLLPFFLAPTQWDPAIATLARHFTVVVLGGPFLGGVAMLEDRARAPTYQAMFRTLIDLMAPRPGEAILDVGGGSGALDRALARRLGGANPITAVDPNGFLRREAAALAAAEGLGDTLRFVPGNAEALPFADNAFGCAFSVTVLEECDADRALAELVRVVAPGGRIGVIVRAIDLPQWWNVSAPASLHTTLTTPPQSVAPGGVADASLYRRLRAAGLRDLVCYPFLVTLDDPDGPIWRYREDFVRAQMSAEAATAWDAARDAAHRDGLLIAAHALHCAVGTKPSPSGLKGAAP